MLQCPVLEPVQGLSAWRGRDIAHEGDWIHLLTEAELAELEAVGHRFLDDDPDLRRVVPADYPLPVCAPSIRLWADAMERGRGFVLVRGLRTPHYSDALSASIFFVIGLHLGQPMRQTELGDMIQHVLATSEKTMADPGARSVRVRDRLNYHSDSSDVVALMCLRSAKEGGASSLISSTNLYNEILARRPDLAGLLFQPWHTDWRAQDGDAPKPTYESPMISIVDGVFSAYIGTRLIRTAQNYPETPRLTAQQLQLLDLIDEICADPDIPLYMDFRPGDMQWVLNYVALHSRTAFQDHPEPGRKRHLLRLWVKGAAERPMTPRFGRYVVKGRDETRGAEVPEAIAKFRITEAAAPRMDWGS
ncbi:MAG: taurine dioxygenase [Phenylobacterium sp.]|nr:taurine dioxygenase [Phenylobacterium sp.]